MVKDTVSRDTPRVAKAAHNRRFHLLFPTLCLKSPCCAKSITACRHVRTKGGAYCTRIIDAYSWLGLNTAALAHPVWNLTLIINSHSMEARVEARVKGTLHVSFCTFLGTIILYFQHFPGHPHRQYLPTQFRAPSCGQSAAQHYYCFYGGTQR